ncbi:MAG: AraC family ligand binding domain-containing protein [Lachnospiraceae bacterium]|nr:AraC family ligand binding domain-containing protein [Lachnospiraceae bacterium]
MKIYSKEDGSVLYANFEGLRQVIDMSSFAPVAIDFCGKEACSPGYSFGPETRAVYIIHFVISGSGRLVREGKTYDIKRGDAFIIYPGEENYYQADNEDPWTYMWIGFHGMQAEDIMGRTGFTRNMPVISCTDPDLLEKHMDTLLQESEFTYIGELRRMSELYAILALLTEGHADHSADNPKEKDLNHRYVMTAVNLLIGSGGKQVLVADVARTIGISRNYLDEIFKSEMGMSPKEFLMNYRVEKASALLAFSSNSISAIAEEVGYTDPMTFSKAFKKRTGKSPSEFRESGKKDAF